jgi:lysylphosphatidylglycerol synthetase-like protein (DUF2156 family)
VARLQATPEREPVGPEDDSDHERRQARLRARVRELHDDALAALGEPAADDDPEAAVPAGAVHEPDHDVRGQLCALIDATDELLAFEDRLPVLADLPARALSVQVVGAAALAILLGGVLIGLGIWRDLLAVWWLPVLLGQLAAAVRVGTLPVAPAAGEHRRQRYAALAAGVAGLLIGPLAAVNGWLIGLLAVIALAVALVVLLDLRRGRS